MYTNKNRLPHRRFPPEHSETPGETQLTAFSLLDGVPLYRTERYVGIERTDEPLTVRVAVLAAFIPLFAYSFPLTGVIANEVVYGKVELQHFVPVIGILVVLSLLITALPLAIFAPQLLSLRRRGLQRYEALATSYSRSFHQKSIEKKIPRHETLLGSADTQSLADLGNSFEVIGRMQIIPIAPPITITACSYCSASHVSSSADGDVLQRHRGSVDESSHVTAQANPRTRVRAGQKSHVREFSPARRNPDGICSPYSSSVQLASQRKQQDREAYRHSAFARFA